MRSSHTLINVTHLKNIFIYAQECAHLKFKYIFLNISSPRSMNKEASF